MAKPDSSTVASRGDRAPATGYLQHPVRIRLTPRPSYVHSPLRYVKAVPRISSKHQVTLPVESLEAAGLRPGDEVVIEAEGADRIVHRAPPDLAGALGVFDGLYEAGYLERLRSEERA